MTSINKTNKEQIYPIKNKIYTCELCDYQTYQNCHLTRHKKSTKHIKNLKEYIRRQEEASTPVGRPRKYKFHKKNGFLVCDFCDKAFKSRSSISRHQVKCRGEEIVQLQTQNNNQVDNSYNTQNTNSYNTSTNINSHNNIDNSIKNTNNINNRINIQYLDKHFPDMIPIHEFIHNIKNDYRLTLDEAQSLINSRKVNFTEFCHTFSKLLETKCLQQTKDKGIEPNVQNKIPLLTTDSNLRTHNEKTELGWKRVGTTDNLNELYKESERQVFHHCKEFLGLNQKQKATLYNFIRRTHSMFQHFERSEIQELKEKQEQIDLQDEELEKIRRMADIARIKKDYYNTYGRELPEIPKHLLLAEPTFKSPPSIGY